MVEMEPNAQLILPQVVADHANRVKVDKQETFLDGHIHFLLQASIQVHIGILSNIFNATINNLLGTKRRFQD